MTFNKKCIVLYCYILFLKDHNTKDWSDDAEYSALITWKNPKTLNGKVYCKKQTNKQYLILVEHQNESITKRFNGSLHKLSHFSAALTALNFRNPNENQMFKMS